MTAEVSELSPAAARGARRRQRTRTAVLDAAEKLLAERAPADIRMEDVAATAGVAPASLYIHFGTKNQLIAATADRLMEISVAALRAAYTGDGSPLTRVQATGVAYMNLLLDHPALIKFIANGGLHELGSDIERSTIDRFATVRAEFEQSIQAAIDAKEIRPIDAGQMSYFLFGAWNGVAQLTMNTGGLHLSPGDVRAATTQAATVLIRGLVRG
jgi:AcrR family transcriptional regulator